MNIVEEMIRLIAAGLIGGLIAHFFSIQKLRKERQYVFVEKLYEKRWETYMQLLAITQDIGKKVRDVELCKKAREDLKEWQKTTGGFLLLSKNSLKYFNALKDALKKNPEKGIEYSEAQRKNMFYARNALRGSLFDDFQFFRNAEENIKRRVL